MREPQVTPLTVNLERFAGDLEKRKSTVSAPFPMNSYLQQLDQVMARRPVSPADKSLPHSACSHGVSHKWQHQYTSVLDSQVRRLHTSHLTCAMTLVQ